MPLPSPRPANLTHNADTLASSELNARPSSHPHRKTPSAASQVAFTPPAHPPSTARARTPGPVSTPPARPPPPPRSQCTTRPAAPPARARSGTAPSCRAATLYPQLRTCTRRRRVWRTWARCTHYRRSMVGLGRDAHVRRCCLRAVCLAVRHCHDKRPRHVEQHARGGKQRLHPHWWMHPHPRLHSTLVSRQGNGKGTQRQRQTRRAACSARCHTHSTSPVARAHPRPCAHHHHACTGARFHRKCEYERLSPRPQRGSQNQMSPPRASARRTSAPQRPLTPPIRRRARHCGTAQWPFPTSCSSHHNTQQW
ncbi:hypothetical protein B0H14DRAFT_2990724 [Mycena olivaceomarginata]|nr:hypothetical protein B0H14DRAFT_2990724 [Mycena olivaceomarginata]